MVIVVVVNMGLYKWEVVHCTEVVLNKGGFVQMGVLEREVMEMGGCTNWGCTKGVVQKGICVNGVTRLIHSGMGLNGLLETGGKNVFKTWRLRYFQFVKHVAR